MHERQVKFLGKNSQSRLFKAKVAVVGCGSLGSHIAVSLARAGVGSIALIDNDTVKEENLGTQNYSQNDLRSAKADALGKKITEIDKRIKVTAVKTRLTAKNSSALLSGADVVLDGTDNFEARRAISDACDRSRVPWIYGSCAGSLGSYAVFYPREFKLVFPKNPRRIETAGTAGMLSPLPAIIANLQATEAIKVLTGKKTEKSLVFYDCMSGKLSRARIKKS